ncbi:hypothetical protein [Methanoregula sp. UBA64]|uniref:hypothetical protein n=1 Tax=Methanoregula sp. UBA64 TaxID=1915554 RepID=UPI0025E77C38|nr:hypothetical protein [Methanoregula sp. UBA64]
MLEEFCEEIHCDQYAPSSEGSIARCLMMQRDLSRVGYCPLGNQRIISPGTPK